MKDLILDFVPGEKHCPYKNNFEHITEEFRHKFYLIKKYLECKKNNSFDSQKKEILSNYNNTEAVIEVKIRYSKKNNKNKYERFYLREFKERFNLNRIEYFSLIISMIYYSDNKYKNIISQIENSDKLTYSCILKLFFFTDNITEIDDYYNMLEFVSENLNSLCFMNGTPEIDPRIYENLVYNNKKIDIPGINMYKHNKYSPELIIREEISKNISDIILNSDNNLLFYVHGELGIGKNTVIERACDTVNTDLLRINLGKIDKNNNFSDYIITGAREALLKNSFINLYNLDKILDNPNGISRLNSVVSTCKKFSRVIFLVCDKNINLCEKILGLNYIDIKLPELNNTESYKIWKKYLKNNINNLEIHEIANKFVFTPAQIKNIISQSLNKVNDKKNNLNKNIISECAYNQVTSDFSNKASIIHKKHTFDELILDKKQKDIIKNACNQVKFRHIVYEKWGMNKRILYGTGLSMLFAGPSGTGKTMAAQVVAHELGLEIYRVDLSQVISKYIGESEKNLKEVFENAKKSNVILLFDETDALFAKRTEVKDSHDRNANLETSYLLQKMEEHSGITIMTTNFLENIDTAFFRRINYVVHFAFPDYNYRKEIWQKMYPETVPMSKDVDFDFLAKNFETSGGNIKNIALSSAFMAASENKKVSMKHILLSLEHELKKQGHMISKDDFRQYSYLIN